MAGHCYGNEKTFDRRNNSLRYFQSPQVIAETMFFSSKIFQSRMEKNYIKDSVFSFLDYEYSGNAETRKRKQNLKFLYYVSIKFSER